MFIRVNPSLANSTLLGNARQIKQVGCASFVHDIGLVNFHRPMADTQAACNFLIGTTGDGQSHHFPLPLGQGCQVRHGLLLICKLGEHPFAGLNRSLYTLHKLFTGDRLGKKIHCAGLDCPDAHRNIAMSGKEDDWQRDTALWQRLLKLHAIHPRHADIDDGTAPTLRPAGGKKGFCALESLDGNILLLNHERQGIPYCGIVIDNENGDRRSTHGAKGNVKWNVAPGPASGSSQSCPLMASMSERLIASPSPMPPGLVVKNGSKIRLAVLKSRPGPLSCTVTRAIFLPVVVCTLTVMAKVGVPASRMASTPLCIRLTRTFCTWMRLPSTGGRSCSSSSTCRNPPKPSFCVMLSASRTMSLRSKGCSATSLFCRKSSNSCRLCPARCACSTQPLRARFKAVSEPAVLLPSACSATSL